MKKIINEKSSQKLAKFLEEKSLHKKDFAEMIGVTLSYVYNLIDETIPFSTRSTTLERIATVMDIAPEEFIEYKIPQEPILIDETIEYLRETIRNQNMDTVTFLKSFPRKKRIQIVDILRGALPVPIDYKELQLVGKTLNMPEEEVYLMWENRVKQVQTGVENEIQQSQEWLDSDSEYSAHISYDLSNLEDINRKVNALKNRLNQIKNSQNIDEDKFREFQQIQFELEQISLNTKNNSNDGNRTR